MGDVAKSYFQTQSPIKHENLHSKQQPTADNSAEAPQAERVPFRRTKKTTKPPFPKGRFGGNVNIVAEYPHKKIESNQLSIFAVRIKGLEPPRRKATDPKSVVATNYTISAGL